MEKEVTVKYDNIVLVVVGEFEKGQDGSYMYPDIDSTFNCYKVLCGGDDIIDILDQRVIDDLEIEAVKTIEGEW